ncbi:hypothetical protein T03_74 [Trichinella britovi]|uniref:Uncharacterized protein n=1 Tax=Trichinella britovi TaxID=45882 RepID=A0A0V1AMD6_TRIBR|nr:hypothetical protein T03_74 [Trichinella britovi]
MKSQRIGISLCKKADKQNDYHGVQKIFYHKIEDFIVKSKNGAP